MGASARPYLEGGQRVKEVSTSLKHGPSKKLMTDADKTADPGPPTSVSFIVHLPQHQASGARPPAGGAGEGGRGRPAGGPKGPGVYNI